MFGSCSLMFVDVSWSRSVALGWAFWSWLQRVVAALLLFRVWSGKSGGVLVVATCMCRCVDVWLCAKVVDGWVGGPWEG